MKKKATSIVSDLFAREEKEKEGYPKEMIGFLTIGTRGKKKVALR